MRHPLRWIAVTVAALLVALVIALTVYVHNLLQPQRFTAMLESELAAAGLQLNLQAPAEPTLFPHPGVYLHGFSLANIGASAPVLQAGGATIAVPWRALLHGEVAIERVDISAPRVDLNQLETLLARLPHRAGPPRLPTITTGIRMSQGTLIRNGSPVLFDFSIATGALAPGQPFHLETSARNAAGRRIFASLATLPSPAADGAIAFQSLRITLSEQHGMTMQLGGHGLWRGGEDVALHLGGTLRHRSLAPPPSASASSPASSAGATGMVAPQTVTDNVTLDVAPARGATPMTIGLKLDGADTHADLRLQPTQFGHWWQQVLAAQPGQAGGPMPITGTAQVQRLDLGWLKASGLSIAAGPDLAPAAGASAGAAPASATSVAH